MTEQKSPMYLDSKGQWQLREQELIENIAILVLCAMRSESTCMTQEEISEHWGKEILELIQREIEKIGNPYFRNVNGEMYNEYPQFGIFEEARQSILKALDK